MDELQSRKDNTVAAIAAADTPDALEALRVEALGKQGWVSQLLKTLGKMTPVERTEKAPAIQQARAEIADAISARKQALDDAELDQRLATETLDLSLPAPDMPRGTVHPVSQVMDELAEIFADLGFAVKTGPEIEDD
jgi:phenylalanyl-tRNA synthetase alpha chain